MNASGGAGKGSRTLRWRSAPAGETTGWFGRALWLLAPVLILAVAGILAARTAGFRQLLEDRLRRETGLTVSVRDTRIGWPYDLVMSGVRLDAESAPEGSSAVPLARVEEIRIGWRGNRGWTLTARNGLVNLGDRAKGSPQPVQWAAWADVEDAGAMAAWAETLVGEKTFFRCERVDAILSDAGGRTVRAAENVRLFSMPVRTPNRTWRYYELSADRVRRSDGVRVTGLWHEWLTARQTALIELGYRAQAESVPDHPDGEIYAR